MSDPPFGQPQSLVQQLAALDQMHSRGRLSDSQFEAAKEHSLRAAGAALLPVAPAAAVSPPSRPHPAATSTTPASGGKRQKTGRDWRDLPDPSAEQQAVLDAVASGRCVTVCSVAGSGKTTLMLQIAQALQQREPGRQAQIVTYNRALKDECEERIRELGLTQTVRSATIHGLMARCAGRSCKNDTEMNDITADWDRGQPMKNPISCEVILLDEVQDLRPSFYRAVKHLLHAAANGLQMVLVGDTKQLLYDFDSYGSDKASAQYIERPAEFFGEFTGTREWVALRLSVSYRLTPSMAAFVNVIWGTAIVGGSKEEDVPVEYWCRGPFPPKDQSELAGPDFDRLSVNPAKHIVDNVTSKALAELLDKYGGENVMFLDQSVKSEKFPIRQHVNLLAKLVDEHGQRRFNFDIKENMRGFEGKSDLKNKTRVWTFCSAKGCEADAVVVFGVDLRDPVWLTSLNQMGVGLSRAKRKLVVIHSRKWDNKSREREPTQYYPAGGNTGLQVGGDGYVSALRERSRTTQQRFAELHRGGYIHATLETDLPTHVKAADNAPLAAMDAVYSATSFTHFSAEAEAHFLAFGTWTVEVKRENLPARIEYKTEVKFEQTTEDVSALYGQALTLMLQFERDGYCPQVEAILENGILTFKPDLSYDIAALRRKFDSCAEFTTEQNRRCMQSLDSQVPPGVIKGKDAIVLVNTQLLLFKERKLLDGTTAVYAVRAMEEDIVEQLLTQYVPVLRQLYSDTPVKTPAHWIYIANMQMAYQNFHDKFRQCGTDPATYNSWVDNFALLAGLERLRLEVPEVAPWTAQQFKEAGAVEGGTPASHSFEYEMLCEFPGHSVVAKPGKSNQIVGVCGQVDWAGRAMGRPDTEPDMIEIKFVSELGVDHRLQTLVYAALHADKHQRDSNCVLFNARTGERERVSISPERAIDFLLALSRFKHSGDMPGPDAAAGAQAVQKEVAADDAISDSDL